MQHRRRTVPRLAGGPARPGDFNGLEGPVGADGHCVSVDATVTVTI
jgi:hypothetical protein